MIFFGKSELRAKQVPDGVTLRAVSGDKTVLTIFEFGTGAVIPPHKHRREQITYLVAGEIEFTVEGETRILKERDGVVIRSDRQHGARVLKGPAKAVDAWYPIREDYA